MQEHEEPEIIICRGPAECKAAHHWPCPLCIRVSVQETWLVEEIVANLRHEPPQEGASRGDTGG